MYARARARPISAHACESAARWLAQVGGREGLDVIPQWRYWQQLPGLVYDGCIFFSETSRVAAHGGRRRMREWFDSRGSRELREPIAAASEG